MLARVEETCRMTANYVIQVVRNSILNWVEKGTTIRNRTSYSTTEQYGGDGSAANAVEEIGDSALETHLRIEKQVPSGPAKNVWWNVTTVLPVEANTAHVFDFDMTLTLMGLVDLELNLTKPYRLTVSFYPYDSMKILFEENRSVADGVYQTDVLQVVYKGLLRRLMNVEITIRVDFYFDYLDVVKTSAFTATTVLSLITRKLVLNPPALLEEDEVCDLRILESDWGSLHDWEMLV
jgi:hypothetical protein